MKREIDRRLAALERNAGSAGDGPLAVVLQDVDETEAAAVERADVRDGRRLFVVRFVRSQQ